MSADTFPVFESPTDDGIAEAVGLYLRDRSAPTNEIVVLMIRKPDGAFMASVGGRGQLLRQVRRQSPKTAKRLAVELSDHRKRGQIPFYTMDEIEKSCGLSWLPPLPNAKGGNA